MVEPFLDVVVWDSHPLSLGATPTQVYIDGISQLENPVVSLKPASFQGLPQTPNFDVEAAEAVRYEGLPPLIPQAASDGDFLFVNVSALWAVRNLDIVPLGISSDGSSIKMVHHASVLVKQGKITCMIISEEDSPSSCDLGSDTSYKVVNLEGGIIAPALTTFGTEVGVSEIRLESSTNDGGVIDPLLSSVPSILGDGQAVSIVKAVDGLSFQGRNTL